MGSIIAAEVVAMARQLGAEAIGHFAEGCLRYLRHAAS